MFYLRIKFFEYNIDDKEYNIFFCPFFRTKIKKIWYFLIFYLGEPQTTCLCIKIEKKVQNHPHPTVFYSTYPADP